MSKALVIKGADFYDNRIGQVVLDIKHADSISVTPSTLSFDAIGAAAQLTATLYPSDAEDAVRFSSSNEDVAIVSSNGVVTVTGCGTCSITATAGSVSAACAVNVEVPLTADYVKAICSSVSAGSSSNTLTVVSSYATTKAYQTGRCAIMAIDSNKEDLPMPYTWVVNATTSGEKSYQTDEYIESHAPWTQFPGWLVPIKLPHNCTKIKFKQLSADYGVYPLFYKYNMPSSAELTVLRMTGVNTTDNFTFTNEAETVVNVPDGWDSFTATWQHKDGKEAGVFVNMSDADLAGFAVTFM